MPVHRFKFIKIFEPSERPEGKPFITTTARTCYEVLKRQNGSSAADYAVRVRRTRGSTALARTGIVRLTRPQQAKPACRPSVSHADPALITRACRGSDPDADPAPALPLVMRGVDRQRSRRAGGPRPQRRGNRGRLCRPAAWG